MTELTQNPEPTIPAEWGNEPEGEIPETELKAFDQLVDDSFQLEAEIREMEKQQLDPLKAKLRKLNEKILATLKHHDKTSYKTNFGMVIKAEKFSAKFPKNNDSKELLADYMGDDVYFAMSQINYQTFNSWYKEKMEEAAETGNMDFQVPGVEKPTYVEYLQRRR